MKNSFIVLAISLLLTTSAFSAETTLMECTTAGDALDSVTLVQTGVNEGKIRIVYMSGTGDDFLVQDGMDIKKNGKSVSLIGTKNTTSVFGGGYTDAALFTLSADQSEAHLAANGLVYLLTCRR